MSTLAVPRSALRALLIRAAVLWALARMLIVVVGAVATTPGPVNPIGVVVLCPLLGVIDLRRRKEIALWGNLGLSTTQLAALFAIVAALGELLLAARLR